MARPLSPEVVADICIHMNEDHADAVLHYARVFANCTNAASARLAVFDPTGMELEVVTNDGSEATRIPFDHPLRDADDARATLIAMARQGAKA